MVSCSCFFCNDSLEWNALFNAARQRIGKALRNLRQLDGPLLDEADSVGK